jgi:asparagine synthase (glutamine-hydrolysing)
MCGIAGLWEQRARSAPEALVHAAGRMADALRHRGPDAGGVWYDAAAGLALGHRRLSIIDLSPAGAQPMVSSCGRFVLSYNGEIYNAGEMKPELEACGRPFRGHSDTEVIVEGMAVWGVETMVKRLIGMFTMAVWDRRERVLYLVRDRLGIKPLYWAKFGDTLIFGSELKALRAYAGWTPTLNHDAVAGFLRLAYVPGTTTIYRDVNRLPAGTILTARAGAEPAIKPFLTLEAGATAGQQRRFPRGENEAVEQLDMLLSDAVRRRMVADVPLGAFLSGGVDSSMVVALMQANSTRKVRSFSIGFDDPAYDEAPYAKAIAAHLGTDHTELYVSPEHALGVIPRLPDMYDEPFADASQIPTFLVSEMTRQHVTVALSGDGGDEVFGGYNRYTQLRLLRLALSYLPKEAGRGIASAINAIPPHTWDEIAKRAPASFPAAQLRDKMQKLAFTLEDGGHDFYQRVIAQWWNIGAVMPGTGAPHLLADDQRIDALVANPAERMQYLDTLSYLPDDILAKVDRASMAVSLEARVPLLDHRVVAFAWSLPSRWKARPGSGKYILRRVLDRYVPRALMNRPKAGFAVPIDAWLRGPLRDWAESLLDEARLKREGLFSPAPIRATWKEHLEGTRNWQYRLWDVLMFQAWKERWLPN